MRRTSSAANVIGGRSCAVFLLGMLALCSPAKGQDLIDVPVGYSEILKSDETPATVVVGRPEIADVTIANRTIILTAKQVGLTNLILLDADGDELLRTAVQVVPLDRRAELEIRVIEGGSGEDGTRYLCGPEPGCVALAGNERRSRTTAWVTEKSPLREPVELPPESAQSLAPMPGEPAGQ
jgi:hypothetical protein